LEVLTANGFEGMADAMAILFNEAMQLERSAFLEAGPYERSEDRRGYANGFKPKTMRTRVGEMALQIPQVRDLEPGSEGFYPKSLERGLRSERALKVAISEMYVQGVSTRRVTEITRAMCGLDVSSTQVSRASQLLDTELGSWRSRPLGCVPYVILDARYEKVRQGGAVVDCAVLVAIGVREDSKRTILGVSVAQSEAEAHWRDFLESLQNRGMHGTRFVVSDDHAGIRAALRARMPGVKWQRCQFHLQRNATAYIPRLSMRREVAAAIRSIFNATDRVEAERRLRETVTAYGHSAPKLAAWMETNIPEGLTIFELPAEHRVRLRTTNSLELLNKTLKRRTRVAGLFPNDAALLRLVSAVLIEVCEEWETGKIYLSLESR
jgi:transposase-like protein